ncbi:MAG: DUF4956 domain-containing protein [Spirochaetales bacterium]|nr:DUF4956 domain-containing protein [Spirochaetales bacterium]
MDKTLTFKDIFRKGFWENFNLSAGGELTFLRVLLTLGLTIVIGFIIYIVYRITYRDVLYSRRFNVSLLVISLVSSLVIMVISSNLLLSLGMVGALSIVRFRTAVKDPFDTVFMFWAISAGIAMGAGVANVDFYWVGFIGSIIIGGIIILMSHLRIKNGGAYLLVLRYASQAEGRVRKAIAALPRCRLKAKTETGEGVEMTLEIRLKDTGGITRDFMDIKGVRDVSLVTQNEQFRF